MLLASTAMGEWALVAWLGIVVLGCGDTTRNSGHGGASADGVATAGGAGGSGGSGGSGAGGQAGDRGADSVTTGLGGVSGAAGSSPEPECIAPTGDLPDLEGQDFYLEEFALGGGAGDRVFLHFDSNSTAVLTSA